MEAKGRTGWLGGLFLALAVLASACGGSAKTLAAPGDDAATDTSGPVDTSDAAVSPADAQSPPPPSDAGIGSPPAPCTDETCPAGMCINGACRFPGG
jgi:hypothetical protein